MVEEKEQVVEVDVAMSSVNNKVLIASDAKDNTSQGKEWIFNAGSTVQVCSQKELFNSLVAKRKGLSRWWIVQLARSSVLGQSRL